MKQNWVWCCLHLFENISLTSILRNQDWEESYHAIIYRYIRMTSVLTSNREANIFGLTGFELLGTVYQPNPHPTHKQYNILVYCTAFLMLHIKALFIYWVIEILATRPLIQVKRCLNTDTTKLINSTFGKHRQKADECTTRITIRLGTYTLGLNKYNRTFLT